MAPCCTRLYSPRLRPLHHLSLQLGTVRGPDSLSQLSDSARAFFKAHQAGFWPGSEAKPLLQYRSPISLPVHSPTTPYSSPSIQFPGALPLCPVPVFMTSLTLWSLTRICAQLQLFVCYVKDLKRHGWHLPLISAFGRQRWEGMRWMSAWFI